MDALVSFRISSRSFAFIVDDTLYDVMFPKIGMSHNHPPCCIN
jgi:hypothetical protein